MSAPKTLEECKQRARIAALVSTDGSSGGHAEEIYNEAYFRELFLQAKAMTGGITGCIDSLTGDLLDLCGEVRKVERAPTTIDVIIRAIVRSAQDRYDDDPQR